MGGVDPELAGDLGIPPSRRPSGWELVCASMITSSVALMKIAVVGVGPGHRCCAQPDREGDEAADDCFLHAGSLVLLAGDAVAVAVAFVPVVLITLGDVENAVLGCLAARRVLPGLGKRRHLGVGAGGSQQGAGEQRSAEERR